VDAAHEDAIHVSLYEVVCHDAVATGYPSDDFTVSFTAACLNSGEVLDEPIHPDQVRRTAALNKRVGLLEMTNHEFLDKKRRRQWKRLLPKGPNCRLAAPASGAKPELKIE
jgi:hypothetical protein